MFRPLVYGGFGLAAVTLVVSACNSGSPTQPQQQQPVTPTEISGTITFATAGPDRAPIASHSEAGFTVQLTGASWETWTSYGSPAPAVVFFAPPTGTGAGEIRITAGGAVFAFRSIDLYSSLTPIPYLIVGTRSATKEVEVGGTLPGLVGNTFGNFRTVVNPSPGRLVDTLTVTLTNPLGGNPMGFDTIVLTR